MGFGKLKDLSLEVLDAKSAVAGISLSSNNAVEAKLKYAHPWKAAVLELSNTRGSLQYNLKTRDLTLSRKYTSRLGTMQIKQLVPNKQLYLVPNPEVKMTFKPWKLPLKVTSETVLTHDYLSRRATIQQDLVYNGRHRASVTSTSGLGITQWSLTAKPGRTWLSSAGLHMSRAGPVAKLEGAVGSGKKCVKVKTEAHLKGKAARLEVNVPVVDRLRANLTTAVSRVDKTQKPSVLLGARLDFQ